MDVPYVRGVIKVLLECQPFPLIIGNETISSVARSLNCDAICRLPVVEAHISKHPWLNNMSLLSKILPRGLKFN